MPGNVHAEHPKSDAVVVMPYVDLLRSSENHSKTQYVTFLENIPIGTLAVHIKRVVEIPDPVQNRSLSHTADWLRLYDAFPAR